MTLSFRPLAVVLGVFFSLSACDASLDGASADLTDAEVVEAAEIVADALAEDGGGLFASVRDLTASVDADSMRDGPRAVRGHRGGPRRHHPPCRAAYELTYDETTGTHLVTYQCEVETDNGSKSYASRLAYQYRDASGGFVPTPAEAWDVVDAVTFGGTQQGAVSMTRGDHSRESSFEQEGEWALTRLADDATPATLAGRQQRSGVRTRTSPDSTVSTVYSIVMSGDGIELREGDDGLGHAAVGQLDYTLTVETTRNDETETRTVEGTIDLEEDGRALFRILGIESVFRVSLGDGATERDGRAIRGAGGPPPGDRPGGTTGTGQG